MRILGRGIEKDESTPICAENGSIVTQTIYNSMSHAGYVFSVVHQSDVGSGNAASLLFTVAASATPPGHVHFTYEVICEGEAEIVFYEDVTRTVNTGNATTPICINRANPKVSAWGSSSVYKNSTVNTTNSIILDAEVIGSAKKTGGTTGSLFTWTLCRGKTYAIIVTDQSGAANETTIRVNWGRHIEVE